jgi:4-methyl-5(b-hydroxyethyl)-thiazole monophosphate biosynthesis
MSPMPAPTVLVILADGFEEIEAVTPIDLLRRAGASVNVAALGEGIHVTGRCGITLHADSTLASVQGSSFDCLLLPGGPGVSRLRDDPRVGERVKRQSEGGGWIAAICAAPLALKESGILEGRRFTAHFSVAADLPNALFDERVVSDGQLVTSRGAGTAVDFGLMLVEKLFSRDKAHEIARSISA